MSTAFPGGLDGNTLLPTVSAGDFTNAPSHSGLHSNANDAIKALEAKVGINGSLLTTTLDYKVSQNSTLISGHIANTSNPHAVTKAQLSLGNVDNTADTSKPVSTVQKTYIDAGDAALEAYVDSEVAALVGGLAAKLSLSGGTMAGPLILAADPVADLEAATKQYVDAKMVPYTLQHYLVPTSGTTQNNQTYFSAMGFSNVFGTGEQSSRIYFPAAGNIKKVYVWYRHAGTNGTTETSNIYLRINSTTDYLLAANIVTATSANNQLFVVDFDMPVAAGDWHCLKWVTPTWVTPPAQPYFYCTVLVA